MNEELTEIAGWFMALVGFVFFAMATNVAAALAVTLMFVGYDFIHDEDEEEF